MLLLGPCCAVLLVLYIFYALHAVTDGFFVPACAICCDWLHLPDDVAGATLLGAGLNAPELFGHALGLLAGTPVGLGAITGSFNFNVLAVAGFTALLTPPRVRLQLEMRYVARDVAAYVLALGLLQWTALDGVVEPLELAVLLAAYALYVTACLSTGAIARACCSEARAPRTDRPHRRRLRPTLAPAPGRRAPGSPGGEVAGALRRPLLVGTPRRADADGADGAEAALGARSLTGGSDQSGGRRSCAQLPHGLELSAAAVTPGPVGRLAAGLSRASLSISSALHALDDDADEEADDGSLGRGGYRADEFYERGTGGIGGCGAGAGTPAARAGVAVGCGGSSGVICGRQIGRSASSCCGGGEGTVAGAGEDRAALLASGGCGGGARTPARALSSASLYAFAGGGVGGGGGSMGRWSPLVSELPEREARTAYAAHVRAARRAGYNLRHAATPSSIGLDRLGGGGGGGGPEGARLGGYGSRASAAGSAASEGEADWTAADEAEAGLRGASRTSSAAAGAAGACGWRGPHTCPPSACGSVASSMDACGALLPGAHDAHGLARGVARALSRCDSAADGSSALGGKGGKEVDYGELPPPGFGADEAPEPPLSERLLDWPAGGSLVQKGWAAFNLPLALLLRALFPSPAAMARGWFPLAMLNGVLLLALITYAMSLLCSYIAASWGIPDELIGSTVVAMGTSLPNVFAAVSVGRAGKADMAVCQAFGSNAFDVFVAFALPLAVKSLYLGGVPLEVEASSLSRDVTVDLVFVALFLALVGVYRGRMRPSFGVCALGLYLCWFAANLASVYSHALDRMLQAGRWR